MKGSSVRGELRGGSGIVKWRPAEEALKRKTRYLIQALPTLARSWNECQNPATSIVKSMV